MRGAPPIRWFLAVVTLGATACVAEVGPLTRELGRLEAPERLDFGRVQVGEPRTLGLVIDNLGPGPLHISAVRLSDAASGAAYRFEAEIEPTWLLAGTSTTVPVRFVALEEGSAVGVTLSILTDTDDPDRPDQKQTRQVELTGEPLRYGLAVEPNPVDFGVVEAGPPAEAEVTFTNLLDAPITVQTPDALGGRADLYESTREGRFEVDAYVGPAGDMPRGRAEIGAGESLTIPVRFMPPGVGLGANARAVWRVAGCAAPECLQDVLLTARTESEALACQPEDVDFGAVFPDLERTRTVLCTNRSRGELTVLGAIMTPSSDPELGVDDPGAVRLAPGAQVELRTWFRPTELTLQRGRESAGELSVQVQDEVTGAQGSATVRLFGQAGGARLVFSPNPLDFGEVALRTQRSDVLIVENIGYETAEIRSIDVDTSRTGAFSAAITPFELPRGASVELPVTFSPNSPGTVVSGLRFVTNDAVSPEHAVGLVGVGLDLQPCMYALDVPEVQFGGVRIGESAVRTVTVRNTGPFDCLLRDFRIEPPPGATDTAFSLEGPPLPPTRMTAGQTLSVSIRFSPVDAGDHRANLAFYVSDPQDSNPRVPLFGAGRSPVEVVCPPAVTTPAGQPVDLAVMADATTRVVRYDWSIVAAPSGGIGTPDQWAPNPPTAPVERFLPFLVGVYDIQVTVFDELGNSASCNTLVTAEGRGLRVTLTWDGSGDVDLHVHRGTTDPWFSGEDCYYANPRPIWNASWPQSDGPNPELDFDNTTANGPENTRVNVVEIGETYTIAAHNYARAQGRRATIQLFCGGGTTPDATYTSRPLVGMESSNCSNNDFWRVATVVFDTATSCRVTPIDTYGRSQAACNAY